jgi:hypothetical protein
MGCPYQFTQVWIIKLESYKSVAISLQSFVKLQMETLKAYQIGCDLWGFLLNMPPAPKVHLAVIPDNRVTGYGYAHSCSEFFELTHSNRFTLNCIVLDPFHYDKP